MPDSPMTPDAAGWRDVLGYEGRYEVSDDGRVRRVGAGEVGQFRNSKGYLIVRLSQPRAMLRVHRLVAQAFIPNPTDLPMVNHLDHDRANNRASNLEWCTNAHNLEHATKAGRMRRGASQKGKRALNARFSDAEVIAIRFRYARGGVSHAALAREYRVHKKTITSLLTRETYPDLPAPPEGVE